MGKGIVVRHSLYVKSPPQYRITGHAYDELGLGIVRADGLHNLGVSSGDLGSSIAPGDIVRAQHEHDNVSWRVLDPGGYVVVGNINGQPARVALVVLIPLSQNKVSHIHTKTPFIHGVREDRLTFVVLGLQF